MRKKEFSFIKWVLFLFFLNSSLASNCNNCCKSHKEINEPRRSVKSILKPGETPLCDRLLSAGWYRFTSFGGTKMPETPVTDYHCGTQEPIWLQGRHPTEREGNVARKACISSFGNTCRDSTTINVKRCPGNYFVYYLRPLYYCATAYCAGFGVPCPDGKVGDSHNCFDPPAPFSSSNLGLPEISYIKLPSDYVGTELRAASVILFCKVNLLNGIKDWRNVTYLIEWVAEGRTLKNETMCEVKPGQTNKFPCPGRRQHLISRLQGDKYTIGQSISCKVSAKFTTSPKNVWSPARQVPQPFFAGLKVNPTVLNVENCKTQHYPITITPTIPVRKTNLNGKDALPKLNFRTPKEVVILGKHCEVDLKQGIKAVQILVRAACLQAHQVSAKPQPIIPKISFSNSPFWNRSINLPNIGVTIGGETEIEQCLAEGDPHYYTLRALTFGTK
ncbi:von Willebrand factor D and EGF domain-containing protein-like [Acropora muricata]|uniref:von Willebrand factor D and EGF domain-containing protein-like n=1 Tax=Acropora muricata TaxID=159855 RepID=UPI0034E4F046